MDPFLLLILVLFALLVLIAVLSRGRMPTRTPQDEPMTDVFEFDPDEQGAVPVVTRRTRVVAPVQNVNGKVQRIRVIAQPLPQLDQLVIPAGKGIESLDILVMNPIVLVTETDKELNDFDPPLTVTVWLNKQDGSAGKLAASGAPAMSLITGYQADDGWKFERLPTDATIDRETGEGTLTAQVRTLAPKDPMWAGRP